MNKLLDDYARVTPDDTLVVVYTPESRYFAACIDIALRLRGLSLAAKVAMRPIDDLQLREALQAALPSPSDVTGHLTILVLEVGSLSHVELFAELFTVYRAQRVKLFRVIDASDDFFAMALNRSPQDLTLRNATLLNKLRDETIIRVTTPAGTDVTIEMDHERYDWISIRGQWRPDTFVILPAGEIATYPANVNGVVVADGGLNTNVISDIEMRLENNPLTVTVENSIVTDFACANPDTARFVESCLNSPNGRRVGELGFGTNDGITSFFPANTHLNERFPGLHLGLGQHNQPGIVPYVARVHLDIATRGGTLHLPGAGETLDLAAFTPQPGIEHPPLKRDQDVVGSCCAEGCSLLRMSLIDVPSLIAGRE
ncbi:hypothetical protein [Nonomuraea sp. 10N515B]|uniref:hypothetical protein n=1 Tax=Nonomuraea sp. 10N515B TaxID=3457422 RepID=UPI003FCDC97D